MSSEDRQFKGVAPYFMVRNLQQSLDYYHRAFGFKMLKLWGEPPTFAMPPKQEEPEDIIAPSRYQGGFWDVYVWINDALFAECRDNGAVIEYEPCIQDEYDMKEFAVRDPDGRVIAFGQHHEA